MQKSNHDVALCHKTTINSFPLVIKSPFLGIFSFFSQGGDKQINFFRLKPPSVPFRRANKHRWLCKALVRCGKVGLSPFLKRRTRTKLVRWAAPPYSPQLLAAPDFRAPTPLTQISHSGSSSSSSQSTTAGRNFVGLCLKGREEKCSHGPLTLKIDRNAFFVLC